MKHPFALLMLQALFFLGMNIQNGAQACQVIERSYSAPSLGRNESYLLLLPDAGVQVVGAVYFLHGRDGDRHFIQNLGACAEIDRLARVNGKSVIVAAPDGGNGYWVNGAHTNEHYRDLVAHELVTQVENEFPNLPRNPAHRILAGISMGGHGALQIAINDPGIFGFVGAHSPVFRTQEEVMPDFSQQFGTGVDYQSRDPFSLILIQGKPFTGPLYIDMGGQDPWLFNTRNFQNLMKSRSVPGVFKVGEDQVGGHAMGYWQFHLHEYFDWYFLQFGTH